MRVKVPKPARTFLEMDEIGALIDASGEQDAKFDRPKQPRRRHSELLIRWTTFMAV